MDGSKSLAQTCRGSGAGTGVWLCVGSVMIGAGCAEHRISLDEFLRRKPPAVSQATEDQPDVDIDQYLGSYKVGPGDVLDVVLAGPNGTDSLPHSRVRVDRNGAIELPVVGALKVAGMELEDVEDTIQQAYSPSVFKETVCHVELASVETTNVLVVGAVTGPGLVPLRRTERNMLYAIVSAGGVSELASGQATLRRVRRPQDTVTFNLTDPVQLSSALAIEPLQHGDIVYVHAAQPNTIFVGGLVNRPGPQDYQPGARINVLQVLAAANGVRTDVFPKYGTLIRQDPDGRDAHVRLDLKRLATGQDPNIQLAAGDILWVPETFETKVQDFLNRSFFLRAGVSVTYNVTGMDFLNRRDMQSARYGGTNLQDTYDPLGFLGQNTLLRNLSAQPPAQ